MKNKSLALFIWLIVCVFSAGYRLEAREPDDNRLKQLEALVMANPKESAPALEELSGLYFAAGQYNQFADFLKRISKDMALDGCLVPAGYYLGLCRYHQLRRLEESQAWQEYFDKGADYRQELFDETRKIAIDCPNSPFAIRAQIINWLEHKARNDSEKEDSLDKLISLINGYVKQSRLEDIEVIKEAADILVKEKESAFSKAVYNLYVNRMIAKEVSVDKLRQGAEDAWAQGNLELSEAIYERYLQLVAGFFSKDKFAQELIGLANKFAATGPGKNSDPQYAEKIFAALEDSSGADYFSQDLQYLRAYNLERMKEYAKSALKYEELASRFPAGQRAVVGPPIAQATGAYTDKVEFKLGLIYTYILGQKEKGLSSWQKIVERLGSLNYVLESLYHKSLILQYEGKPDEALLGYEKIIRLAADNPAFRDISARAESRQKEIAGAKDMEYNLKIFLDSVLKEGQLNQSPLELLVSPVKAGLGQDVKFSSQQPVLQTGCIAPELTYLWSGDLGDVALTPVEPEFVSRYRYPGVKAVNLVVLSPAGVVGATLEMVEADEK